MTSPFTLRPTIDGDHADAWESGGCTKSDPTKDWWEHIYDEDDGLYLYTPLTKTSVAGTDCVVADADIPSISSGDGELTSITAYARGKATPAGIRDYELWPGLWPYGWNHALPGDNVWRTENGVDVTYFQDLEDDLWDLEIGGYTRGTDLWGVKYFDYAYAVVNYTPAPPTCFQQSITISDDILTMTVSETRYRWYTWLTEYGYQVRIKDSEDILYTDTTEGDINFRTMDWFGGERYPNREIDLTDYVTCGVTYEARSYGTTEDGTGYGDWVEFSVECAHNYPLYPVIFPLET